MLRMEKHCCCQKMFHYRVGTLVAQYLLGCQPKLGFFECYPQESSMRHDSGKGKLFERLVCRACGKAMTTSELGMLTQRYDGQKNSHFPNCTLTKTFPFLTKTQYSTNFQHQCQKSMKTLENTSLNVEHIVLLLPMLQLYQRMGGRLSKPC